MQQPQQKRDRLLEVPIFLVSNHRIFAKPFKVFAGWFLISTIHVWYIYLHLVDFYGKCWYIYHTWMLWVMFIFLKGSCSWLRPSVARAETTGQSHIWTNSPSMFCLGIYCVVDISIYIYIFIYKYRCIHTIYIYTYMNHHIFTIYKASYLRHTYHIYYQNGCVYTYMHTIPFHVHDKQNQLDTFYFILQKESLIKALALKSMP